MPRPAFLASLWLFLIPPTARATLPESVAANLRLRVEVGECPGIVVGRVTGSAGAVEFFAAGLQRAGGRAVGSDTLFEIGSVTKTFTTLLYRLAVEGGVMHPTDRLGGLLPEAVRLTPSVARITLDELATHRSGLPRMPSNISPADARNPYADYSLHQLHTWLEGVEVPAGRRFQYSNAGMGILGHVLERKTNASYEALLRGWIAGSLDLPDTCITLSPDQRRRLAVPHREGRPLPLWDIPTLAGAGAVRSTPRDLLRWASLQAGIADSPLASAMRQCQQSQTRTETDGIKAATGWFLSPSREGMIVWHAGETGGTRCWLGFIRSRATAAVVLANGTSQIDDIGLHLLAPENPLRRPQKEIVLPPAALRRCEGAYALKKSRFTVKADGHRLAVQFAGQPPVSMLARSEIEFFSRTVDAELHFTPCEIGAMQSVTLHRHTGDEKAARIDP